MVETSKIAEEFWEKTFDVTANLRIRSVIKKGSDVKFEIY
jgi:hypothetical protein